MLQQYYGSSSVEPMAGGGRYERSTLPQVSRTASHGQNLNLFGKFASPRDRKVPAVVRGGSLDLPSKTDNERVSVNVSGKMFEFSRKELEVYPESLLAKQSHAGRYYDFDRKHYFFDRSRIAFDSICSFYQFRGAVMFPENYPEQLMIDEFYFFGLYNYLEQREKDHFIKPSEMAYKVTVVPKHEWQVFVWHLLEHQDRNLASKVVSVSTLVVIAFSIITMCLDTVPGLNGRQLVPPLEKVINSSLSTSMSPKTMRSELFAMETFCVVYFTIEIALRYIVSPMKPQFWFKSLNIIDLISILPYYFILGLEENYSDTAIVPLRMFRLFRAFRTLKVSRYISGMKVLGQTLREALSDLWMIAFLTVIGTLLFASCVFYFENIWDPGTPFNSIPISLWWSIVTISTVGYGDMAPKTLAGKLVGSMCAISGILLIAPLLPIVYERWQRYYLLDQEGKKINAAHKLLRDLEKKRLAKSLRKEAKASGKTRKDEKSEKPKNGEGKETGKANVNQTTSAGETAKPAENPDSQEERAGDDVVWTHIKRASLKRRESSTNMLRGAADNRNAGSSRGSSSGRLSDPSSRKGKDIVTQKKPVSISEASPDNKTPSHPIFTFTDEEKSEKEKDWNKPGPSNVVY